MLDIFNKSEGKRAVKIQSKIY